MNDYIKAQTAATAQGTAKAAREAADALAAKGKSGFKGWAGGHADKLLAAGLMGGATLLGNKLFKRPPTLGSQIKGSMGTALGYGLAGTALGAGILAANKGADAVFDPIVKQRSYDKMMAANPSLKQEDKDVTQRSFNTLYKFNPDMAKDPTTAGSFVRRAAMFKDEGIQSADVKTLAEIRKNMSDAKKGSSGFMGAGSDLYAFRGKDA